MIRAVLFDLDGTLLDSAPDLVGALNELRQRNQLPALAVKDMQAHVSRGAVGLLQAGMPHGKAAQFNAWREEFLSIYALRTFERSRLYDGAAELLSFLETTGISWGIVTNKPGYLTHPIVDAAGLGDTVSVVVCGDTLAQSKPHPAPVLHACEKIGVEPSLTLFVGDDCRDIEAGLAAGVHTCAALYGYGSAELLLADNRALLNAGLAIESLSALNTWLRDLYLRHAEG